MSLGADACSLRIGSFWSPMNVKKVWNRGLETSSKVHFINKKITYDFALKTAYNLSTNIELYNSNNNSQDKQLLYTPHYKLVFKSQISYKEFTFTYLHNYTGYVFTSRDNDTRNLSKIDPIKYIFNQ